MSISTGKGHDIRRRTPGRRSQRPEALELVADLLLALAGRDREYPAYSEEQLARKALKSDRIRRLGWSRYTCTDVLVSAEIDDMARSARLTEDECAAWKLSLDGHHLDEIAEVLGTTRPRAERLVNSACGRVARCSARYRGLYAAYQSLVHRYTYHRPLG